MGRSFFVMILMISAVLALCFSQGFGRRGMSFEKLEDFNLDNERWLRGRMMMVSTMDYADPGANTNPRTGALLSPPAPGEPRAPSPSYYP